MEKTMIVFIDDDRGYLDALFAYMRGSIFRERIWLRAYASPEAYAAAIRETGRRFHLVAADVSLRQQVADAGGGALFVGLEDGSGDIGFGESISAAYSANPADIPRFDKYQPLSQLFSALLAIGAPQADNRGRQPAATGGEPLSHIVAIYSATGGAGKTTVAANLAKLLSFQGKRTFYLNLERLNSAPMFPAAEDDIAFARLLYHVRANAELAPNRLLEATRIDNDSKVEYVPPLIHAEEMDELSAADTERLLAAIARSGHYRFVIVDLESGQHPRTMAALEQSDTVIWLLLDELQCWTKTKRQLALFARLQPEAKWMARTRYVMNKYTGSAVHDPLTIGLAIDGYLPYIPAWKSVQRVEQLQGDPVFAEALRLVVCRKLEAGT
ncbi:MAG: AAA family ATPase [Paenibacillaceae bacterium]|nr:AAA family ATPase [Paenibacillaceae bacterium]